MKKIIKKIIWTKIGNLEWSEYLGEMSWYDAIKKCEELGGRLPTRIELINLVDNYREEIENWDKDSYFWSSTEHYTTTARAWTASLHSGGTGAYTKVYSTYVRCVRP